MSARAMTDNSLVDEAVKIAAGAGGLGGGLVFIRWLIGWLSFRHDRREARLDAVDSELSQQWQKYRETLEARTDKQDKRIDALEEEVERCHSEKRDLENRMARMEGFATGRGEARGAEQVARSLDSMIKDKRAEQ